MLKYAQQYQVLRKWNLKSQGNKTTHPLELLNLKRKTI